MMKFLLQKIRILIQTNIHYQMISFSAEMYQFLYPS